MRRRYVIELAQVGKLIIPGFLPGRKHSLCCVTKPGVYYCYYCGSWLVFNVKLDSDYKWLYNYHVKDIVIIMMMMMVM